MCTVPARGRGWAEWTTLAGQHGDQRWGRAADFDHPRMPSRNDEPAAPQERHGRRARWRQYCQPVPVVNVQLARGTATPFWRTIPVAVTR